LASSVGAADCDPHIFHGKLKTRTKPGKGDKGDARAERNSLQKLHILRPDNEFLLLEASLKFVAMAIPPFSVYAPHHHFKNDHIVTLSLSGHTAEALHKRVTLGGVHTRGKPLSAVVVERQKDLDELHGLGSAGTTPGAPSNVTKRLNCFAAPLLACKALG